MSNLQKPNDIDLESANGGDGRRNVSVSVEGGGPVSSDLNEIVGVLENAGNFRDNVERRVSTGSFSMNLNAVDLEAGALDTKLNLAKTERDCRICHLSMDASNQEYGVPIELGCSCKDDLAAAHKQCAEAWFKIKGNKTCEICGSVAQNVTGVIEQEMTVPLSELNEASARATTSTPPLEALNFWHGHRFLNFLLACMVFAFVISWLFHFNVPS